MSVHSTGLSLWVQSLLVIDGSVLVLLLEAAWWVATFMRADAHVMELSLLGRHIAAISIEGTDRRLSTAMDA